ncbi:MAG: APC family permease [Sulfolobaceae archaeon]|nr:APC family permease [Sulfolobaceae archaeon]
MKGLSKGSLSLREAYGQAMAVTAPLGSVVSTTTAAIGIAGKAVVFATILALIGSTLWIYTLTRYSTKIASAGGYYIYGAAAWRNKTIAYYEAITEVIAYSALNAVNALAIYLIISTVLSNFNISVPSYLLPLSIIIGLIYPTFSSMTIHIKKLLGNIVSVSATLEVIFLFSIFIYAVATKGINIEYFEPTNTSLSALGIAMILTIVSISGAGASTYLGEEAKVPRKTITAGMWLSLILGGSAILVGTYGIVALWNGSLSSLSNCSQPLIYELSSFGLPIVLLVLLLSLNSLLASNIGTTIGAARVLFNLARERAMPKVFEKVNKEYEPIIATVTIGLISALFTVVALAYTGSPDNAFQEISVITSVFWLLGRIVDGFGVPIFYWRINELKITTAIIPIIATGINLTGIILTFQTPDIFQTSLIMSVIVISTIWYLIKARKSIAGTYVVDDNNQLVTLDEYIKKLKSKEIEIS